MGRERSYSDEQLVRAIALSSSWRATLRQLGLVATSAGAMRSVRARADDLGLDYRHFKGQRRWTNDQLRTAIAVSGTWSEVVDALGLLGGSALATVKGHALRLGLDTAHLTVPPLSAVAGECRPDVAHLSRAGSLLAAAWFTLCGQEVSWPLEPSRYDLLVRAQAAVRKVQVKTTTVRAGHTWKVYLSTARRERKTYDPDEIDDFFIIDGDLNYFLIPVSAVGGLHLIHVGAYDRYRMASGI
ncbi:hypothetical protein FCK90_14345 [Kocuria coralli]|uniref:PD(D/E)XK endonuclease domain-containing protein n=1 Tax=Kocuria coralli TaxID=1461025 RepID=A0A5J5KTS1_9MICC|nr:group I intron-associated PD-(D/E)XK endonuclease [Kocuria coralli]KAA9393043.1 hypothetical protein FCK90_14345 [Kocuria coralli]